MFQRGTLYQGSLYSSLYFCVCLKISIRLKRKRQWEGGKEEGGRKRERRADQPQGFYGKVKNLYVKQCKNTLLKRKKTFIYYFCVCMYLCVCFQVVFYIHTLCVCGSKKSIIIILIKHLSLSLFISHSLSQFRSHS